MRLIIPVILAFLAGCGSGPETGDSSETKNDSSMSTMSDSSSMSADSAAGVSLTDAQKADGWQLLFDGKSKSGWHGYLRKGNLESWKVADGALHLDVPGDGKHIGEDIVTDDDFENFHFKVDWKISKAGNSGIIFLVKESPEFEYDYYTGPEMQVLDNDGHPDGKIIKHRAGDLYDLITSKPETVKPVGEWNTAEIIKNKDSLQLVLNGTAVVKTKLWDNNWKKLVAGSKFKQWPSFGTFKSGKIALQDHGNQVWYRNIMIKKL
jgi:hypothetical protein